MRPKVWRITSTNFFLPPFTGEVAAQRPMGVCKGLPPPSLPISSGLDSSPVNGGGKSHRLPKNFPKKFSSVTPRVTENRLSGEARGHEFPQGVPE